MSETYPELPELAGEVERTGQLPPLGPGSFSGFCHRPRQLRAELRELERDKQEIPWPAIDTGGARPDGRGRDARSGGQPKSRLARWYRLQAVVREGSGTADRGPRAFAMGLTNSPNSDQPAEAAEYQAGLANKVRDQGGEHLPYHSPVNLGS